MNVRTVCVLVVCSGCAGAGGSSSKIGHIDPAFVTDTADRQGVFRAELYTASSGALDKVELYHHDEHAMPEAVLHLAWEKFPGSKVESFESEFIANGDRVYEVELTTADGRRCEISSSPEGKLRYTECVIGAAELPPAVAKSVAEHAPGGTIVEVEKRQGDGPDQLRVESKMGEIVHYLIYDAASGQLQSHALKVPAVLSVPAR